MFSKSIRKITRHPLQKNIFKKYRHPYLLFTIKCDFHAQDPVQPCSKQETVHDDRKSIMEVTNMRAVQTIWRGKYLIYLQMFPTKLVNIATKQNH